MKKEKYMRRACHDLWRIRKSILLCNFFGDLLHAIKPYLYLFFPAWILDELIGTQNRSRIILLVSSGVLLNAVALWLSGWLDNMNMENQDISNVMEKSNIIKKLMQVRFSALENGEYAETVARYRGETTARGGIFRKCLEFWESAVTSAIRILTALIILHSFWRFLLVDAGIGFLGSPYFSLCTIIGTVIACLLLKRIKGRIHHSSRALWDGYSDIDRIYQYYRDEISNYQTGKEIRVMEMQPLIMKEATTKLIDKGIKLQNRIANREAIGEGAGHAVFMILNLSFYLLVGVKAISGLFSLGSLVIYVGALMELTEGLRGFFGSLGDMEDLRPRIKRYYEIIDETELKKEGKEIISVQQHLLEARHIFFQYGENMPSVLNDVSLTIHPGEKTAIVGENGSGKTTLIKILCGLYLPKHGKVLLDGQDIRMYSEMDYQKLFAMVFQDYTIYSLALGENVAVSEKYDQKKVIERLNQVGFPSKYTLDTVLYQDCDPEGMELSGGEAQKVALARALYKEEAQIIILDEPTSAMDPIAEMALYSQLNHLTKGRTTIYISHRLSSCRFCDQIIVLSHGKVVQCGTHEDLIRDHEGEYYKLWHAQAQFYYQQNDNEASYGKSSINGG